MKGISKANLFMTTVIVFSFLIPLFLARYIVRLIGYNNYIIFAEYILFLLPIIIYLLLTKESPKKVFSINKISFVDIILSILIAFLAHPVAGFFSELTGLFFDNPVEQALEVLQSMPFPTLLFMMAVTPAICEEAVTRGIFLHGYKKTNTLVACLANGVAFSMLHMDLQQSLYTFVLGVIFAYMVKATNSIWSSVLCHFTFNSISLCAMQLLKLLPQEEMEAAMEASANAGSNIVTLIARFIFAIPFAVGLVFVLRFMRKRNNKRENIVVQDINNNYNLDLELTAGESKGAAYLTFGILIIVYVLMMFTMNMLLTIFPI